MTDELVSRLREHAHYIANKLGLAVNPKSSLSWEAADELEARARRIAELERIALFLWDRLDDIDTADDAYKSNGPGFRDAVYRAQRRRFEVGSVGDDGQTVTFATLSGTTPPADALDFDTDWFVVSEAINDAYSDGEGRLSESLLSRLFAHHGLVVAHRPQGE